MERAELGRTIEAILLVAVEPLAPRLLAELVEEPVDELVHGRTQPLHLSRRERA